MPSEAAIPDDLEQLRRRFEEFRATQPKRSRFPDALWAAAAGFVVANAALVTFGLWSGPSPYAQTGIRLAD